MKTSRIFMLISLIVMLALVVCAGTALAADASDFTYTSSNGEVTITGYTGTDTELVIPAEIDGLPVTGIGQYAFDRCTMQSITLPETLRSIASNAFSYCENLTSVHIPASLTSIAADAFMPYCGVQNFTVSGDNTVYAAVGGVLMSKDLSTLVRYPSARAAWKYSVPAGTKHIGAMAFAQSVNLDLITLPAGLETIGEEAFTCCISLCEINLPQSVTQIGEGAFADCSDFLALVVANSYAHIWCQEHGVDVVASSTDVVSGEFACRANGDGTCTITGYLGLDDHVLIPDEIDGLTVTYIAEMAFDRYTFSAITLPDSLEGIGNWAFNYCQNLTAIHLPAGVSRVTAEAFQCYSGIDEITVDEQNACFSAVDGVLMSKDQTTLVYRPAANAATEYEVPAGVTVIAGYAFGENRNLERVVLPESVTQINAGAFIWCAGLKEINLPASISYIAENAFADCGNFVATVYHGSYAHNWCLRHGIDVNVLANEEPISVFTYTENGDGICAITSYTGTDMDVVIPSEINGLTVTGIARGAFERSEMTSVTLPDTLGYIEDEAFSYCENLAAIHIPANVYSIGAEAFAPYCGVQNITVSEDNQTYADSDGVLLSKDQTMLLRYPAARSDEEYIVPDTVDYIGSMAFAQSLHLNTVVLPDGMEFISDRAFSGCVVLEHINLPGSILTIDDDDVFANCGNLVAQVEWSSYAHTWCVEHDIDVDVKDLPFTYSDNGDGTCAITGYTGTDTELVIPSVIGGLKVTAIGDRAFAHQSDLTSVVIPEGVTTIGMYAFSGCYYLTDAELPETMTTLGNGAFWGCNGLSEIRIPAGVTSIGSATFGNTSVGITVDSGNTVYKTVDGLLFTADGKELMYVPRSTSGVFAVPEGTEVLSADFQLSGITQIRIPASVKKINAIFHLMCSHESFVVDEANTAYRSTNGLLLTKDGTELIRVPSAYTTDGLVVVPDGVRVIRNGAMTYGGPEFYFITEIELPEGITTIESNVTQLCTLKKINLPASLTSIADDAFHNPIDDNVATVYEGTYAEAWCEKNGIIANVLPLPYTYTDNGDGTCTITGYTGTDIDVVIPSEIDGLTVTAIGDGAFENNSAITSVTIPEGVTSIGEFAFWSCSALQKVDLPESLVTIRDYAFCFCSNLTEVAIPASTTNIASAFYGMPTVITVDSANPAYKVMDGVLYTKDGETLKFVPSNKTGVFAIPEGTEVIERCAFFGCTVVEIRIPASVKEIGIEAFGETYLLERFVVDEANAAYRVVDGMLLSKDRTQLITVPMTFSGKVVIPEGVRTIYMGALRGGQPGITELVLPEGISTIEGQAILNQPLEKINLPVSLDFIEDGAFYNSTQKLVAQVEKGSYAHMWCVEHDIDVDVKDLPFTYSDNGDGTCTITGYTGTDMDVVIPSEIDGLTVTGIARGAFERSEMTSVALPDTLGYIEDEAFSYCENLAAIHIPANVYSIGAEAFAPYCGVQNITVSEDNQTYADSDGVLLSKDQTMLLRYPAARSDEEYIVPDTVDYIGSMAFAQSLHLNTVVLPDGMEFISDRAFSGCVVLEHINLPGSILTIKDDAFANCGNLVAQVEWSSYAHTWCVEHDIDVDVIPSLQLLPASRIDANAIPFGMAAEVELVDGLYHVIIDNEATDWDAVYTLQEPMHWYNPDTGESGVAVEKVMMGAMFDKPEGAAYSKSVVGNAWGTDEEILQALEERTSRDDLTVWINSWKLDTALFGDDGSITLNEFTPNPNPYTYAILWLDENGEEMFAEKVEFCFEYTAPEASHTYAKKLIPAESIMGNVENAEGVTCEIADGSIITTQMDANAEHVTEIVAPENAVSYSMHDNFYDPWAEKYEVTNGVVGFMRSGTLRETITTSSLICWYDADGQMIGGGWITFTSQLGQGAEVPEPAEGVQLLPASRIDADAIPFGMAAEVELVDGLYHVTIDNEATDWDAVYTLQEPMQWYNPDTGESGVAVEKVMMGAMFDKPEGAAYSKSVVGNVWATDEEILNALDQETSVSDLTNTINSWKLDVALFDDDGSITLNEFTEEQYAPYTYAILWLDENGEEMFAEKVEFCFEYTAPEASHTYAKKLIPAESIMGNVGNAEGVTCEIADGSIITTQMDANAEYVTEIVAPQNAASYSMHDNFYDPWAEKYEVTNGVVGFMRSGTLAETITTSSLICWYDADGEMIGGGWITFTSQLGQGAEVPEPAEGVQLLPASRIDANAIPFGMAVEVELKDGLYHVIIDNEATDWDAVYTLQEPMQWYNPGTGESGVAVEKVMMGAMFDKPEGAAYSKSIVGNYWKTDEEILQALADATRINDLTSWINSWSLDVAWFNDDGSIRLKEYTEEIYAPYTCAILWLDENGEEMFAEKVEFCFEYTAPEASHTYAKKLIPAERIMGNVENAEGVTCEIADGSIITTQMDANAEYVTEILAPANAVSYSMHDNFYDPWAEKYEVTNGVVGFMRSGPLAETITTSSLICWYDADGQMIGGGWITFTSKLGEKLISFLIPASMQTIEEEAFAGSAAQSVIIPDGCTAIGSRAFADCAQLRQIVIPASVTDIAADAFSGCTNVTVIAPEGSAGQALAEATEGLNWRAE